jgi:hypothetical protein
MRWWSVAAVNGLPFNERAVGEVTDWQKYKEPTRGYDETVFKVICSTTKIGRVKRSIKGE